MASNVKDKPKNINFGGFFLMNIDIIYPKDHFYQKLILSCKSIYGMKNECLTYILHVLETKLYCISDWFVIILKIQLAAFELL